MSGSPEGNEIETSNIGRQTKGKERSRSISLGREVMECIASKY